MGIVLGPGPEATVDAAEAPEDSLWGEGAAPLGVLLAEFYVLASDVLAVPFEGRREFEEV